MTLGTIALNRTKQKTRYAIDLPEEVLEVLRWHVETQLVTPEQRESVLSCFRRSRAGFGRRPC
jgi:hypothetical protein